MTVIGLDLRGRLERVYIEKKYSDKSGIGFFYSKEVIVKNGNLAVGRDCLVKFDLRPVNGLNTASFITLNVPENFNGLSYKEYFFIGLLENGVTSSLHAPRMRNIEKHYRPGDVKEVLYYGDACEKDSPRRAWRGFVSDFGFMPSHNTLTYLLRKEFRYSTKYSRLIIVESNLQLKKVADKGREQGIYPIILDDLKTISNGKIAHSYI